MWRVLEVRGDCAAAGATVMGPIETELRARYAEARHEAQGRNAWANVSWSAFRHLQEAAWRLGVNANSSNSMSDSWRDIASDAIEAAEALGL